MEEGLVSGVFTEVESQQSRLPATRCLYVLHDVTVRVARPYLTAMQQ